jgi:hypothetical protein
MALRKRSLLGLAALALLGAALLSVLFSSRPGTVPPTGSPIPPAPGKASSPESRTSLSSRPPAEASSLPPAPQDESAPPPETALAVTIVDDRGEPLGSIVFRSFSGPDLDEDPIVGEHRTDSSGRATVAVQPGEVVLVANRSPEDGRFTPGAITVDAIPGTVTEVTIELLRRSASLSIHVAYTDGTPTPGVTVQVYGSSEAATDEEGLARLTHLRPGNNRVNLVRAEDADTILGPDRERYRAIELAPDSDEALSFTVHRAGSLLLLLDPPCADEASVRISYRGDERRRKYGTLRPLQLPLHEQQDELVVPHLPQGHYTLLLDVAADSLLGLPLPESFEIEAGRQTTVRISPVLRTEIIEGLVVDEAGSPVPGIRLGLAGDLGRPGNVQFFTTDAHGRFRVAAPSGHHDHHIVFHPPPAGPHSHFAFLGTKDRPWLVVPERNRRSVLVTLTEGLEISGRCIAATTGKGLNGVTIHIDVERFASGARRLTADSPSSEPGHFSFRHLRPGTYILRAIHAERSSAEVQVELFRESSPATVVLELR